MNIKRKNSDDVHFIYERVIWYLAQKPEDLIQYFQHHKADALYSLPHKKGRGIICGREASEKFYDIANRCFSSQQVNKNKTNLVEFIEKLKKEFLRRFIENREEITDTNIDRMISTAYKSASKEFKHLEHYIPCAIFFSKTIKSFEIGPISFLHKSEFESIFGDEINRLPAEIKDEHQKHCEDAIANGLPADKIATEEQSQQIAHQLVDRLFSSFSNYDWVAVVTIPKCHEKVSYDKAIWQTKTALNILKLLFGSEFTHSIRVGSDPGVFLESARLTRENGKLDISLSNAYNGNVIGDEWLEILKPDATYVSYFELATNVLEKSLGFSNPPPLCVRFVDALSWYGDAVSEQSFAAKIVKYVTAIERLVGTGIEKDENGKDIGVTEIVTSRASILYSLATNETLQDSKQKVKQIYSCRSDLVHGSLSPFDDSCFSDAHKAEEISKMVLLMGLHYFSLWGIDDLSINQRKLRAKYQELETEFLSTASNI